MLSDAVFHMPALNRETSAEGYPDYFRIADNTPRIVAILCDMLQSL